MTRLSLTLVIVSRWVRHCACPLLLLGLLAALPARPAATLPAGPAADLPLPALLERIGQQVEKFWQYFSSVTCTEALTQSKIGEKGKALFEQRETFDYLIILQASGMDLAVDETLHDHLPSHRSHG